MAGRSRATHVLHHQAPPHPLVAADALLRSNHEEALLRRHQADDHLPLCRHPILALEDRLDSLNHDIHALLVDNLRLAATHVALQKEVIATQHEFHLASAAASRSLAERDTEVRELHQRSIVEEAKVGAVERMRSDLVQVRADIERLAKAKDNAVERLKGTRADLVRARADQRQVAAILAEMEAMKKEIQKGRAAFEFEKKVHADNYDQAQIMQTNMLSLAREEEKLRAELANAEKRARAAAAAAVAANPGYGGTYQNIAYVGAPYASAYTMQQVQTTAESGGGVQYGVTAASHNPYDIKQTQAQSNPKTG